MLEQLGASISKENKEAYARSSRWNGKIFHNASITTMDINIGTIPGLLKESLSGRKERDPKQNIPFIPFDSSKFQKDGSPKFVWYGHSVLLLQVGDQNLLIDPMLGPDASPIGPIRTKRYTENTLSVIDSLPEIDAVLLTYDHYDHLDLHSIQKLKSKIKTWFVALGMARHLIKWGVPEGDIKEFDWWEATTFEGLEITFTPSRHFSGRGPTDRAKSLWGGWVIIADNHKVYWSGDGGYDNHFKEVGDKFGEFDWGFIECGQYNRMWHAIHMYPEESVKAALDANVLQAIPVHWGAFTLANHHWTESPERFMAEAKKSGLSYWTPKIGEIITTSSETSEWWEEFK